MGGIVPGYCVQAEFKNMEYRVLDEKVPPLELWHFTAAGGAVGLSIVGGRGQWSLCKLGRQGS